MNVNMEIIPEFADIFLRHALILCLHYITAAILILVVH